MTKMKILLLSLSFTGALAVLMIACAKSGPTSTKTTTHCTGQSDSLAIDSNVSAGVYAATIKWEPGCDFCGGSSTGMHADVIEFDSRTQYFTVMDGNNTCSCTFTSLGQVENVGGERCPDFFTSITPGGTEAGYFRGQAYKARFPDGHSLQFVAGPVVNGVVKIHYVFQ